MNEALRAFIGRVLSQGWELLTALLRNMKWAGEQLLGLGPVRAGKVLPAAVQADTLAQAYRVAKEKGSLLLVYVHSPHHPDCDPFVDSCLSSDAWETYFNDDKFVLWSTLVTEAAGDDAASALSAFTFPFLAVISTTESHLAGKYSVLRRLTPSFPVKQSAQEILEILDGIYESKKASLLRTRAEEAEILGARSLRQQQEDAYQRSLAADRLKKQQREKAKQEEQEKEILEQERIEKLKGMMERAKGEWKSTQKGGDVQSLSLKWPDGSRVQQSFGMDKTTLLGLYGFVYSSKDTDQEVVLSSNFPKISYNLTVDKEKKTLAALGIEGGSVLYISFVPQNRISE